MSNKKVPINYASRDFQSIKSELVALAKKYYPDNFKDFSEAGFGSMVMDNVAYIGDVLSFYLDYQANESFFDTANEFRNVVKLAKQLGYKFKAFPSSQGILTFYANIPAISNGLFPDPYYMPVLKKGSIFSSNNGNTFTLTEDVFFSNPANPIATGDVDPTSGTPTSFIVKTYGKVISGKTEKITVNVGTYQKFLKIFVNLQNVSEIINVEDSSGNKYYEVDYLSQDVVYRSIINRSDTNKYAPSLMKPFNVPRRFIVEREGQDVFLQFGTGYDSSGNISDAIVDPSKTILKLHGKDYFSDEEFDPSNLIESDAFGIVPENTTLTITARVNSAENVNAGADSITKVTSLSYEFEDLTQVSETSVLNVISSIECTNEEAILGNVTLPNVEELKRYVINSYGAQNRAVTKQDYEAMCYKMPSVFGNLKRVKAARDADSFKRNINLHVISEDENGKLISTNSAIKENLKVWINKNRMINDTIDILDAKIINLGITFEIITEINYDRYEALSNSINELKKEFSMLRDIGEPLFVTDIYAALKKAEGVLDVTRVEVFNKTGPLYSNYFFDPSANMSPDGRYVILPEDCIFEIKFPDNDIKGIIV